MFPMPQDANDQVKARPEDACDIASKLCTAAVVCVSCSRSSHTMNMINFR
jgi:hypothetical protein